MVNDTNSILVNNKILRTIRQIIVILTIFVSSVVLYGWLFEAQELVRVFSDGATMKVNTAIVFLLSALNMSIFKREERNYRIVFYTFSAIIIFLGLFTLLEVLKLSPITIDNLIIKDTLSSNTPGRMSPATALCSVITGISFLGLRAHNNFLKVTCEYLMMGVSVISLVAIIGYVLFIPELNKSSFLQTMAIHTSVLFFLISINIQLKNSSTEFSKIAVGNFSGSKLLRRLVPLIVIFPIVLSFIFLNLVNNQLIAVDFGIATYTVAFIFLSLIYIAFVAKELNIADNKKHLLQKDLSDSVQSLERYKYALDQISIVAITDHRGVIKYANDKFCEISKFSKQELIGKTHAILNSGHHPKTFFKSLWGTINKGQIWSGEIKNKAKDGSFYWTDSAIIPFLDGNGNITEHLAIRQDITQRKNAEELLNSKYVKALKYKNKELEEFAYITSHDLQEPLRTINGFTNLLNKKYSHNFDERAMKSMEFILSSTKRMSELIKNLLDYSRLGNSKILNNIDCNKLIEEVKEDFNTLIMDTKATIFTDKLPILQGHETELRLMFQNLISNAIKFRKKDIAPIIKISVASEKNYWKFSIQDNGIGIEEQYVKRIFSIFQRLHNKNEYEGSGIGLSHCLKIANLHEGKIWVYSEPKIGSTFYVTIKKQIQ